VSPEGPTLDVTSPYTGTVIGKVPLTPPNEVARAVEEGKKAFPAWANTPIKERSQRMFAFRALLEKHLDELGHSAAAESGKTFAEGRAGVLKGMEVVEFALSIQNLDLGGSLEVSRGVTCEYRREPLGVVVGISPFNFPAMVPMWMFPIAVVLGNAFIHKPSEKVPLTACRLGELMMEAGIPPGIFQVVHGARDTVDALITHPDVQAVGFVGSSAVAKKIYETGAQHGKRVLALGGAKNHLIVVPDADKDMTAQAVLDSFTGCAGQRCMAASVLVAVGDVDPIIDEVRARAEKLGLGAQMGAIIDGASKQRIEQAIEGAEKAGAKIVVDGRKRPLAEGAPSEWKNGSWLGPTIIDGVSPTSDLAQREIFGPVLAIVRVKNLAEALQIENANPYGNAASIFTTSGGVAQYVAEHAKSGMIGVNVGVPVPREPFSFGGINDSKFGHGDITGPGGIEFWTQQKKITRKWALQSDANWMS
jgi:malonate-semialdehyde dehydrogenase (acetylating)/methylmalonate-semialdehyde dehydrogenase